jgi:transcriptional regulator with XRE-family HTH domain
MITGAQIRAARGLLNLSVAELAERTGLAVNTIRRAEATNHVPVMTPANLRLLVLTFEDAGVLFIPADACGPGVRFKSPEALPIGSKRRSQS